ncbi:hypothetical protein JCM10207_004264 [Rhodosporidiobolus poonsookiae]
MAQTAPPQPPRLNPTRPTNLHASGKRTSKHQLLQLYQQLLPLNPTTKSLYTSFTTALGRSLEAQPVAAVWDDLTQSVWVSNDDDMTRLWRQGFFGKGFLSRSEPSWRRRVENRRAEVEGREKRLTSEEITAQRRLERKGLKLTKKLERDAERLTAASAAASMAGSVPGSPALSASSTSGPVASTSALPTLAEELDPKLERIAEEQGAEKDGEIEADEPEGEEKEAPPEPWQLDAEHTQLQPEEAFFLLFAVDCLALTVSDPLSGPPSLSASTPSPQPRFSILEAFALFLRSAVPSIPPSVALDPRSDPRLNRLDSPFLLNYAAYHHYRSMGWVVRSGVKFCVDWVLYGQGGPVGGHAEFAVVVVPSYADPSDTRSNPFRSTSSYLAVDRDADARAAERFDAEEHLLGEGERKNSWRWFHTINRVCSGVKKTLVLLHVVIPPFSSLPSDPAWVADHPAQALARLEMREVVVRRFLAGRMRD